MRILISGSSGLVGSALLPALVREGHEVRKLVRGTGSGPEEIRWEPSSGDLDMERLVAWGGAEAVIHLAGENIAKRRWSPQQKARIRDSRVKATEQLCKHLAQLPTLPRVFIGASAVGFYGDRGEEILDESSSRGNGFLAEVAEDWEQAARALNQSSQQPTVRLIHLRFGMILSGSGGALPRMVCPFKLGLGGKLSTGRQWVSWVSRCDVLRVISFSLQEPKAQGVFNVVAPEPVQNAHFTRLLAEQLRRPAILPVPAFALKILFGEMAEALLLASQRVIPTKLLQAGFHFEYAKLGDALEAALHSKC